MAVLRFPQNSPHGHGPFVAAPGESRIESDREVAAALAPLGIDYERWSLDRLPADASAEQVLEAYAAEIDAMKQRGGYVTADVIDVNPTTPNLDAMLAKFDREHTHSEDEVRFIVSGRGIFFLHLGDKVTSVEVGPAATCCAMPRGTTHWFTLCEDRRIRAIRWFQDTTGWTPHYTDSGVDQGYQPLCFGPAYLGPRINTSISA